MLLASGQSRVAGGFLGWSARELAEAASLGLSTIERPGAGNSITAAGMAAIQRAREGGGVRFNPGNGGAAGARLCGSDPA